MVRRWFRRRFGFSSTLPRNDSSSTLQRGDIRCDNIREFSYASLKIATNDFSKARLIGQGGFSRVFKGLLSDGTLIAVKKYRDAQSTSRVEDFLSSVEVMSYIRHRNVDKLIGYCVEDDRRLLVTEFAEFGSLRDVLRKETAREEFGKWHTRASICIGIARGLSYLHHDAHPTIIHRDIKSGNILLDSNLSPRITDFDLVKLFYDPNEFELTHHTDIISGTYGYMAPEYVINGQYSGKTDVFSFGVVILEIVSGRTASGHYSNEEDEKGRRLGLITWASRVMRNDRVMEFIDPVLTDYPIDDVQRFINVAFLCLQRDPKLRPNMQEVMHMLFRVNSNTTHSLTTIDMSLLDDLDGLFKPPDSSRKGSITSKDIEDEEEISILEDEGIVISTGNNSADVIVDSITDVNPQGEIEVVETCTAEEQRQQRKTKKKKKKPGIVLSGSGNLVERLSQTTVFKKHAGNEFPEAVYPPYHTSVFRRVGSRNGRRLSQTMVFTKNVCPVAVYPPSHTRVYKRLGSGNERRLSQTRVFKTNVCPEAVYPPFHTRVYRRLGSRNLYASDF